MEHNSISINYPILKYSSLKTSDKINHRKTKNRQKKEEKNKLHSKNYREKIFHIKYQKSAALYTHLRRIFNKKLNNTKEIKQKFIEECKILHNFTCVSFANGASKHAQLLVQF